MSRTVRVGVDFSAESLVAVEHAVAIARRLDANLEIVHATEVFHEHVLAGEPHPEEVVAFIDEVESGIRVELETIRHRCSEVGVSATAEVVRARPVDALCSADRPADAVVVGSTGRSRLARFLVGSTAARAIRARRGHVFVARPGQPRYDRVLVATDFEEPSFRALEAARALASADARIDLLHAWRLPTAFTGHLPAREHTALIERLAEQTAERVTAEALAMIERAGDARIEAFAVRNDAASEIVDRSARYDLVAVGSHGRSGIGRILAGSVAERVVAHAACSVLVVH